MTTASIYVRISYDPKDTRAGVHRQYEECTKLCERMGFEVGPLFEDNDLSATSGVARPAFEELLVSDPEVIVAWHQDRLLRTTADLERVIDLGVNVYMVEAGHIDLSHPTGRAVARTVAAWSTYEGEIKAARQRLANRAKAVEGRPSWVRRPFGNNMDGTVNEAEADAMQWAMKHILGGGTFREVKREFDRRGLRTGSGTEWDSSWIRPMLSSPRVAGFSVYEGEIVGKGQWDAPVPEDLWHAFLAACAKRPPNRNGGKRTLLLTGIAKCGVCEKTVLGKGRTYKGEWRRAYSCPQGHVSRSVPFVDNIVSRRACAVLSRPEIVSALLSTGEGDLDALRAEQDLLRARLDGAATAYASGAISLDQLTTISAEVSERIEEIATRLAQTTKGSPLTALLDVEDVEQWWGALGMGPQREVIRTLFDVRIERTRKGSVMREDDVATLPRGGHGQHG